MSDKKFALITISGTLLLFTIVAVLFTVNWLDVINQVGKFYETL